LGEKKHVKSITENSQHQQEMLTDSMEFFRQNRSKMHNALRYANDPSFARTIAEPMTGDFEHDRKLKQYYGEGLSAHAPVFRYDKLKPQTRADEANQQKYNECLLLNIPYFESYDLLAANTDRLNLEIDNIVETAKRAGLIYENIVFDVNRSRAIQ
jgi:hypothetical protein